MRFVDMLMRQVSPLPDTRAGKNHSNHDTREAVKRKSDMAKAKYRNAMGDGWSTTTAIESRLGMGNSVAIGTLKTYEELGLVERRAAGGGSWNRRKGWEWRWVK